MASVSENDGINSLQEAKNALEQLNKQSLQELASFANPPKAIVILMEAIGILLQPNISSDKFTWNEGRKLLRRNDFVQTLLAFNTEQLTAEQVTRAASYMTREEMQPDMMRRVSLAGGGLLGWFRAVYALGQMVPH